MVVRIGATISRSGLAPRREHRHDSGDTVFHYDKDGHLIAETTAAGALKREYIYLGDMPVAVAVQP
jgi:YD repeat-containing protein